MPLKYCLDCDWYASKADELDRRDRSREAIDHFVETGHAIETASLESRRDEDHPRHLITAVRG